MFRSPRILPLLLFGVLAAAPALSATLKVKGVMVPGGVDGMLTTIGTNGALGGVAYFGTEGITAGFALKDQAVTILPQPAHAKHYAAVVPTSIDGAVIAGIASEEGSFTGMAFKDGAYFENFALGNAVGMRLLKRNPGGIFIADIPDGEGGFLFKQGKPAAESRSLPTLQLDRTSFLVSINKAGIAAGTFNPGQPSVFTRNGKTQATIAIPGAVATHGGFINDSGAIAGTFADAQGTLHGYVWHGDVIHRFDPPQTVTAMQVNGFSNTGYVVGSFTTPDGNQTGFRFQGDGTLLTFGPFASAHETLYLVGVSDDGTIAFDLIAAATGLHTPYIATCLGSGC